MVTTRRQKDRANSKDLTDSPLPSSSTEADGTIVEDVSAVVPDSSSPSKRKGKSKLKAKKIRNTPDKKNINEDDGKMNRNEGNDEVVDHGTTAASSQEAVPSEDTSDLFVLDRTGDENEEGRVKNNTEEDELTAGYGLSGQKKKKKGKTRKRNKEKATNALTKLLPGYTAPMQLDNSSLNRWRSGNNNSGGISSSIRNMIAKTTRSDKSTRDFVKDATWERSNVMKSKNGELSRASYASSYSSFKKGTKRPVDKTAGAGWFHMEGTPMSEELKADMAVIRNRNYLDPKKFYKSSDKFSNVVQVGTVIEGAAEYYSSRLTKKQRRSNLTDEIMADPDSASYAQKKFKTMSQEKRKESQKRKNVHRPKKGKRGF